MTTKTINLTINEGNYYRRVRYNDRSQFDLLIVNVTDGTKVRSFQIKSAHLTDKDSIHLKFDPDNHNVTWSPKEVNKYVTEIE